MAKYGSFKYGGGAAGAEYGTGIANEILAWSFLVFWDDEFIDEAAIMIDLQVERGRDHLLSSGGAWERFKAGEAVGTFDNSDGRFDPYNSGGPLYGFLLPGRVVRISVDHNEPYSDITTTYNILRGVITDIIPFFKSGQRQVRIEVKDGLEWLDNHSIALALLVDNTALAIASAIASQVGFDAVDDWSIEIVGTDSLTVPVAFGNNNSSIALISELIDATAGQVFHAQDGALKLVGNDYTEAETLEIEAAQIIRDSDLKSPWEVVRTKAQITTNPYTEDASAVIWTYGVEGSVATWVAETWPGAPSYPYLRSTFRRAGDIIPSLTVDAIFTETPGAATSPVIDYEAVLFSSPIEVPHGTVNYTDITASADLDLTTEDIGTGLRLTWVWNGALENYMEFTVIFADITAIPITLSDPVTVNASDLAAAVIYGEKTFVLDNPWIQDQAHAQAYADWVVEQLKDAHPFPTIIIESRGELQYSPELYTTKIHLTIAALGIDDTFRVGKISHRWLNQNGLASQTTLKLEPVLEALE